MEPPRHLYSAARLAAAVLPAAPPALAAQAAPGSPAPPAAHAPALRADFEAPDGSAAPAPGPAPGAFPEGWTLRPLPAGASAGRDTAAPHGGRFSLRAVQPAAGGHVTALARRPVTLPPNAAAVRLAVWIRTEGVAGHAGYTFEAFAPAYAARRRPPADARPADSAVASLTGVEHRRTVGPTGTTPWTRYEAVLPVIADRVRELSVAVHLDGTGTAWFDDLTVEPLTTSDVAAAPPSAAARAYALAAFDTLRAHALDADEVDWPALRAHVLAGVVGARTPADAYPAVEFAVRAVNPHSFFLTPADWATAAADETAADTAAAPGARPAGAVLGHHGYLAVPAFHALGLRRMTRYAEAGHAALRAQAAAGVCGYVVDLRGNTGGSSLPMVAAVAPLLYEREDKPADRWRYDRGRLTWRDTVRVDVRQPAAARSDAPVAVLVDGQTGSSGELTVLEFVGRPHTRTFGQPTYGRTTNNGVYALADGARLVVTESRMQDHVGRRYGGVITPDVLVAPVATAGPPPAPAPALTEDPVVRAAEAWLDTQPACRARREAARTRAG